MSQDEEVIVNRFEPVEFNGEIEWICLHDEQKHFPNWSPEQPAIKLCSKTLRIRANDAWSKLPKHVKRAMVAHELGHREYQHYLTNSNRIQLLMEFKVCPEEVQADKHAIKLIGHKEYMDVLKDRRSHFYLLNKTAAAVDLDLRIKELEK